MVMWRQPWERSNVEVPENGYDYIIYQEDGVVYAKNGRTGKVDIKNTELHEVLNSIASLFNNEAVIIGFVPDDYTLRGKVSFTAGTFLIGNGARIDLNELNDVAFEFNSGSISVPTYGYPKTGVEGFIFVGDNSNSNTIAIQSIHIPRAFVIRDVQLFNLHNGVKLLGKCYSATINNLKGKNVDNVVYLGEQDGTGYVYSPINTNISNVEVTNGSGTGITINSAYGTKIMSSYLEGFQTAIYANAWELRITNSYFGGNQTAISIGSNTNNVIIESNNFFVSTDNAYVINSQSYGNLIFESNTVRSSTVTGLEVIYRSANQAQIIVNGNRFDMTQTTSSYVIHGNFTRSVISNNKIYGSNDLYAINIAYGDLNVITGNVFDTANYGIMGASSDYNLVVNNKFINVTHPVVLSQTTNYMSNILYTTLPDTSDSNVSELFKNRPINYYDGTNNYLYVWDGSTWRKVQLT